MSSTGTTFLTRLQAAQAQSGSSLAIGLAPAVDKMPAAIAKYDDPFLPFGKLVIDVTGDLVCAYVFHLSHYLALGAAGAVALERTIAYVPTGVLKILHGPFASRHYARAAFEDAFGADAVTLAPTSQAAQIMPYLKAPEHGAFLKVVNGIDDSAARALSAEYPGQLGVFRQVKPYYKIIDLLDAPYPEMHWQWEDRIYRTRTLQFEDVLRQTVTELRTRPGGGR